MVLMVEDTQQDTIQKLSFKTGKEMENNGFPSPRGISDKPVLGSSSNSDYCSSFDSVTMSVEGKKIKSKELPSPRGIFDTSSDDSSWLNSGTLISEKHTIQWRNVIENVKKKSVRRFSTIPLLTLYDQTSKFRRKSFWRSQSAEDSINCGDGIFPKPTWKNFTRSQLAAATNNFSSENMVGKGGHAEVYKGYLVDGTIVAVKRIIKNQNDKDHQDRVGDFLTELGIIAHINHPNAAKLVGFSIDNGFHLVLEFSPHGSLESLLHGGRECLEWKIRFKVALGIAEGLLYLHSQCHRRIIHRDITASNILLTQDFEPQISDFGLAKWLPEKWTHHVVHPVEGTFGYMAPEYFMHGIVDEKTDVFAYGVLLLELITGRRAVDSFRQSLVIWAKPLLETSNVKELVDPDLGDDYDSIQMKRAMVTALACLHHSPHSRPTMSRVVQILKGEGTGQVELKQKSLGGRAVIVDACDIEDYTCTTYMDDLSRHMQLILE